jgi:hypothetical protein
LRPGPAGVAGAGLAHANAGSCCARRAGGLRGGAGLGIGPRGGGLDA